MPAQRADVTRTIPALLTALILAALAAPIRSQTTHHVPADFATIQAAIDAAQSGDTVLVAPGFYIQNLTIAGKGIRLESSAGAAATLISGLVGPGATISVGPGLGRALVIEGFTIADGQGLPATSGGQVGGAGGIDVRGSSPTIRNCSFAYDMGGPTAGSVRGGPGGILLSGPGPDPGGALIRNCHFGPLSGGSGLFGVGGPGAILIDGSTAHVRASIFDGCLGGDCEDGSLAAGAGAVTIDAATDPPLIEDCEFRRNIGGWSLGDGPVGGAGAIGGGSALVHYCVFEQNQGGSAHSHGLPTRGGPGAILGDAPEILGCIVLGNQGGQALFDAGHGGAGGIRVTGPALIRSTIVAANQGGSVTSPYGLAGGAGGIECGAGAVTILNATVADNAAGGGAFPPTAGGIHFEAIALVFNSILWGDQDGTATSREISGAPPIVASCDVEGGFPGLANMNLPPLFVDPTAQDYHLSAPSPCIDAGNSSLATLSPRDIDGEPRVMGGEVEMGADEYGFGLMPGTLEDLDIETRRNGGGHPDCAVKTIGAGDLLDVRIHSASGTFAASEQWLVGSACITGSPPVELPLLPGCHVDPNALILLAPGPLTLAELPLGGGRRFLFSITSSPPGWSLMIQGAALSASAGNGMFALSEAHELRFE